MTCQAVKPLVCSTAIFSVRCAVICATVSHIAVFVIDFYNSPAKCEGFCRIKIENEHLPFFFLDFQTTANISVHEVSEGIAVNVKCHIICKSSGINEHFILTDFHGGNIGGMSQKFIRHLLHVLNHGFNGIIHHILRNMSFDSDKISGVLQSGFRIDIQDNAIFIMRLTDKDFTLFFSCFIDGGFVIKNSFPIEIHKVRKPERTGRLSRKVRFNGVIVGLVIIRCCVGLSVVCLIETVSSDTIIQAVAQDGLEIIIMCSRYGSQIDVICVYCYISRLITGFLSVTIMNSERFEIVALLNERAICLRSNIIQVDFLCGYDQTNRKCFVTSEFFIFIDISVAIHPFFNINYQFRKFRHCHGLIIISIAC